MISPLGLPVPKKVTARKQKPSASPGSGNFRDVLFNIHCAEPSSPCKWVTAPIIIRQGESFGGRSRAGILPAGRGVRMMLQPPRGSPPGEPSCSSHPLLREQQ